ncbi:MAG: ABC transporter substrate-binding protein [Paenibacillaceae bacterium ZCTH02-B3]|nr:MAG: ABC transporter substrate-binding protein [Paenibacillaceae bacterium ZCTH02-B3]
MKKMYAIFCKLEETLVKACVCAVALLVFLSAVFRTFKHPINWAVDLSLLLFAWAVFLGADMALRNTDLVKVDMIVNWMPAKARKILQLVWNLLIMAFLAMVVWYGVHLALDNTKRLFQTLGISYSWATFSVPIGSAFMLVTMILKTVALWKRE